MLCINSDLLAPTTFHRARSAQIREGRGRLRSSAIDSSLTGSETLWEIDMSAAIAKRLPRVSTTSAANIGAFVTVALFSGIGLLLSLSILMMDQYIPGEWF
jgi:hypothetical protein